MPMINNNTVSTKGTTKPGSRKPSWFVRHLHALAVTVMALVNALAGAALLLGAWGGTVDPARHPLCAVIAMTIPVTLPVMLFVLLMDLAWLRRATVWALACLFCAAPAWLATFPVHLPARALGDSERQRSFTLLSYNVNEGINVNDDYPDGQNPMMTYILQADADVVALQELGYLTDHWQTHVTAEQMDSLRQRYPYIVPGHRRLHFAVLSKYPVVADTLIYSDPKASKRGMRRFTLDIKGHRVALFSVHLQSFGLSDEDKALYRDLTKLRGEGRMDDVRDDLIDKVEAAAVKRSRQVRNLAGFIGDARREGIKDIIVCGDFNDVPASWAVRQLESLGMHEAYASLGFGYKPTYNASRFWFTIDHVLWSGGLHAHSIERANMLASDHYPLLTTFVLDD